MIAAMAIAALVVGWAGLGTGARTSGIGVAAALIHPAGGVVALTAALLPFLSRRTTTPVDAVVLADQVALGLRAGLTMEGALQEARRDLHGGLREEVTGLLRCARTEGLGPALSTSLGTGERLYRIAGRATRTGAALSPAVEALAEEMRHEAHARKSAEARRLPVRLLLPLALLILPGFVLALVGPALAGSLARLDIGL